MFPAIISTIMTSFSDVFWKKSLSYGVKTQAHSLASYPIGLLLVLYFLYTGFDYSSIHISAIIAVILILVIDVIRDPISQNIYQEEKISVIMPYLNLNRIFVIFASFFLYKDVSYISFFIIILTIIVITVGSIDRKSKTLPRNIGKILFNESTKSIGVLLGGWLVLSYGEIVYFNLYTVLGAITIGAIAMSGRQLHSLKHLPLSFWRYRFIGALGWLSWFLSLVVIKNLGLSLSILLGFLGIGVTLLVSYFFLKDIPTRKNIIMTITIAVLIGIGYYFK